jgi:hypothetical protein
VKWNEMECGRGLKCFTPFVLLFVQCLFYRTHPWISAKRHGHLKAAPAPGAEVARIREGFLGVKRVRNFRMFVKNA